MGSPQDLDYKPGWAIYYNHNEQAPDNGSLAQESYLPKSMWILSDTKTELSTVTELTSPRLKLPCLSSDAAERVFPIRSVVSFDSVPSSALPTPSFEKQDAAFPGLVEASHQNEATKDEPETQNNTANTPGPELAAKRPNHLLRLHRQTSYSRLTASPVRELPRRMGPDATLKRYDESPSLPEYLQSIVCKGAKLLRPHPKPTPQDDRTPLVHRFGALLVASTFGDNIQVERVSENSADIIGCAPDELFKLQSFCDIMPEPERPVFLSHVKTVVGEEFDVSAVGSDVFSFSVFDRRGDARNLWCSMHANKTGKYIICEIEPPTPSQAYQGHTNNHAKGNQGPALLPYSTGSSESQKLSCRYRGEKPGDRGTSLHLPTDPDIHESYSRGPELLNAVPRISKDISTSQSLEDLVHHTTRALHEMTSFDRVTVYHFDGDRDGVVVADSVDSCLGQQCLEGLDFEESVFSQDLKRPYLRNKVTLAYERRDHGAPLIHREPSANSDLDFSHCYLIMPPETTDSGTGPQACISIRLSAFGKLWGLIVCHSHRLDLRIHPLARRLCWFVSEIVSSNIERLSYTLPFQFKDQATTEDLHKCREIQTPSGDLLSIFGADYAVASILDESKIMGKPAESQEILALLEYFRAKELGTVIWSTDILSDLEDLEYPLGFHILSSLLYIPLLHDGHDFIIFFRSNKKTENENPEQDLNHALDWSAAEFGKASMLSLLYRTFTDVWQENEATTQSNQLMRLLLANSAHEFRTPLNAIINYLEIALDGNLNQETRENLSRSHSASKSLIYIINDLLDLTNAENGQNLIKDEVFSLSDTLSEATDIFWEEARQKDVDIQVVQHSTLPAVLGDQRRVRQVITNLISNAVQHTSHGAVTIESCVLSECWESGHIAVEVAIHDTGSGMSQEAVEALFCELEQVSNKEYMQKARNHGSNSPPHETENVLGLGLALVARIVRNMDGQLSLRSEQGKGSCFKIRLKFPVPSDGGEAPPTSRNGSNMNIASADGNGRVRNDLASDLSAGTAQDASTDEAKRETYQGTEKSSKIPTGGSYTCGDEVFPRSKQVDVNVELENGESRNLVIGSGGTEEMIQKGKTDESQEICTGHANEASPKVQVQGALDGSDATLKVKQENETSHEQPAEHGKPIGEPVQPKQLHVLVAEDDPINSMIVKKRLEKFGYSVYLTGNGKECAAAYSEPSTSFDLILMDLQMPIVDGIGATKMIRDYEHQMAKGGLADQQERLQKRIPIFAVSATLFEKDRQVYLDAGFDGWIVKPIDFQRVHSILDELVFTPARDTCLRKSGVWEEGGWFEKLA